MSPIRGALLLASLLCAPYVVEAETEHRFVVQKDLSEHCRRRAVPSALLARRAVEAHSQILHFSRLEVPYSCFISIRTETGSNIVLVIQLAADENLKESCKTNNNQLLVYELGETFGGYWGPLPDAVLEESVSVEPYYTLKTSRPTHSVNTVDSEVDLLVDSKPTPPSPACRGAGGDYFEVEVPLLNVSGRLVGPGKAFDVDYDFSERLTHPFYTRLPSSKRRNYYRYNANRRLNFKKTKRPTNKKVTPRINKKKTYTNQFYVATKRKYDTTSDSAFSTISADEETISEPLKYIEDVMKNLKGNWDSSESNLKANRDSESNLKANKDSSESNLMANRVSSESNLKADRVSSESNLKVNRDTSESNLKANRDSRESNFTIHGNMSLLLRKVSDAQHNVSVKAQQFAVYEEPVMFNDNMTTNHNTLRDSLKLKMNHTSLFTSSSKITLSTSTETSEAWDNISLYTTPTYLFFNISINNTNDSYRVLTKETTSSTVSSKDILADSSFKSNNSDIEITQLHKYTDVSNDKSQIVSMVDHKSWENVVQAAPVIAGLLNNSTTSKVTLEKIDTQVISNNALVRRKRRIHSIPIQHARPYTISTRNAIVTTPAPVYRFSDIQDFAQMDELQDDEMYGHVALRYLGKYVGNTLFNICESAEAKPRHVYLMNTSRIVVAINEFTLKRMTIVATAAHTVVSPDTRCAADQIECQVSGTRVCIDEMAACDGVPNCGSYDIYDEDKLRCGAHNDLQHNVYIAAFTFLAALLTMLYILHYWLKRCMPRVSDAFFIYTEGSENFLYLDSIMRSPNEIDDDSKMVYQGHLFEDNIDSDKKEKPSISGRITKIFGFCFARRSKSFHESAEIVRPKFSEPKRMYSFAEMELNKMMRLNVAEAVVQTGESLELKFCRELKKETEYARKSSTTGLKALRERSFDSLTIHEDFPVLTEDFSRQKSQDSELNMLKFVRNARSVSGQLNLLNESRLADAIKKKKREVASGAETEIHNTVYDDGSSPEFSHTILIPETTTADVEPGPSKSAQKRLRFDSTITTIPSVETQDNDYSRRCLNQEALDAIEEDRDHSGGRDFRRFRGNKGKRSKKKSHLSLR